MSNTESNQSDLFLYVKDGNLAEVKYLVDEGVDIHAKNEKALRLACNEGNIDIVKFLVEKGANIHAGNEEGLRLASQEGHIDIVKFLVDKGADIHAGNEEALILASGERHIDIVKFLLEKGANIHAKNEEALRVAVQEGYIPIVKFLVEKGADIHAKDEEALRIACEEWHTDIVKFLVEKGADIHIKNEEPLRIASEKDYLDIVKFLVENGANIHVGNEEPLRIASSEGNLMVVKFLVENNAIIKSDIYKKADGSILEYLQSKKSCGKLTEIKWNIINKLSYFTVDTIIRPTDQELSTLKGFFNVKWTTDTFEYQNIYDDQGHGIKYILQNWDGCDITQKLMTDNVNFLKSLGPKELAVLMGYTHQGDQLANKFILQNQVNESIKNGKNMDSFIAYSKIFDKYILETWNLKYEFYINPIYFQLTDNFDIFKNLTHKELAKALLDLRTTDRDEFLAVVSFATQEYVEDLKEIFNRAPPIDKPFSVFRGTENWYYGGNDNIFKTRTFTSTSINPASALSFSVKDCCLSQFTLKPGARVIFMEPISQHTEENEILIPPGAEFELVQNRVRPLYNINLQTTKEDALCGTVDSERIDIRVSIFKQIS